MSKLASIVAAHPIDRKPYHCIKFVRVDGNGTPLYSVTGFKDQFGAHAALGKAFEKHGGHCFHCKKWMPPQHLSQKITRDHLRAKSAGGGDHLYNLVISCGTCNRAKGSSHMITFNVERSSSYLDMLDLHITKCIEALQS